MAERPTHPLLTLDPELGQLLTGERRQSALAQLQVEVQVLPQGDWATERTVEAGPEHVGLLVLDGVLARELIVEDTVSMELLGPADVLRPWALRETDLLLPHAVRWSALTRARVATLDHRFTATLGSWPEINAVLIDRLNTRAQRLATTQAISQLNGVDRRVLALLWHLAERWGRMTAGGVAVPLPLSHRMLGHLVGARRPSVSTAIGKLSRAGELLRREDGTWLLRGEPVGLPAPDTERVVPIRRRLLGSERQADERPNGQPRAPDPAVTRSHADLRAAMARVRRDSEARILELREVSAVSRELMSELSRLREVRRNGSAETTRAAGAGAEGPDVPHTGAHRRTHPLLDLDPDLGRLLPAQRRARARTELQVELYRLPQGVWSSDRLAKASSEHVGLLLIEGVVSREVVVADCVSTELLGPGDLLRPWALESSDRLLQHAVRWNALTDCRVAVLDRRFGARLGRWPEVNAVLIDRLGDRARRLAATQAISQLNKVERRLLALFWHLAERWGRVTPEGVVIPLTLSHRMLGQLVGARRPTVSTALGALDKADRLVRRDNGTWLVKGDPAGQPPGRATRLIADRRPAPDLPPDATSRPVEEVEAQIAAANARVTPEAAALASTSRQELSRTLARLRSETDVQLGALHRITQQTQELLAHTAQLRDACRRDREQRELSLSKDRP